MLRYNERDKIYYQKSLSKMINEALFLLEKEVKK